MNFDLAFQNDKYTIIAAAIRHLKPKNLLPQIAALSSGDHQPASGQDGIPLQPLKLVYAQGQPVQFKCSAAAIQMLPLLRGPSQTVDQPKDSVGRGSGNIY